jgi:hypothetical protein
MPTSHSSYHAFNSNSNTQLKKIATLITYLWDVENTHDLIDS